MPRVSSRVAGARPSPPRCLFRLIHMTDTCVPLPQALTLRPPSSSRQQGTPHLLAPRTIRSLPGSNGGSPPSHLSYTFTAWPTDILKHSVNVTRRRIPIKARHRLLPASGNQHLPRALVAYWSLEKFIEQFLGVLRRMTRQDEC